MGETFITRRGSGANLNFRVLGGMDAPISPRENDIWIPTAQPITDWILASTPPTDSVSGMVYISVLESSWMEIIPYRDKRMRVGIGFSTQYLANGTSKTIATKLYQNGNWNGYISRVLSENSWEMISTVSKAGAAKTFWLVGDTKDITLTTGEVLTMQIYDFDHDDLADGSGKAAITFGTKNLMSTGRRMNAEAYSSFGFVRSDLYEWLQSVLYPQLPDDLRPLVRMVSKKTGYMYPTRTLETYSAKLSVPSEIECAGASLYSVADEGSRYPIFTSMGSQAKRMANGNGNFISWWLRGASDNSPMTFCRINESGQPLTGNANNEYGVCFLFCI